MTPPSQRLDLPTILALTGVIIFAASGALHDERVSWAGLAVAGGSSLWMYTKRMSPTQE